jgi:predicted NAD-dependent protein-ADP-ribosyltransferase YbiA (DUF1768 family)
VGGLFGDFTVFQKWPMRTKTENLMPSKEKAWRGCSGIIAKMVSKLEPRTIMKTWAVQWHQIRLSEKVWEPILAAKYTLDNELGQALLATAGLELVEFDRGSKRSFWGAKLVDDYLVGANTMGQLLTARRSKLCQLALS